MSDDHKDRFPKLSDGVSPDWRTWKQRVMPELYGKTSAAYPDKNLYQVLEMVPPRERGPLVTPIEEQIEIPRMYPDNVVPTHNGHIPTDMPSATGCQRRLRALAGRFSTCA